MQKIIDWIIESITFIDLVQVLATVVIAFATFVLWLATRNLARVSERKPYVVGNLESTEYDPHYVNFVLINTGNAPAFNVEANIKPALPDIKGNPIEGETETNRSTLILPPNQNFSFRGFHSANAPMKKFDITISWTSKPNGKNRETLTHSIDNKGNRCGWKTYGLDRIAREFEKTTEHLEEIKKHLKPPQDKK